MGERVGAVGAGDRSQRILARAAHRGFAHHGGELTDAEQGDPAPQRAEPLDVPVQRRRAHADVGGDARERDRLQPLGVGERRGRGDDALAVEAPARHGSAQA
jgi:hypothetical protein